MTRRTPGELWSEDVLRELRARGYSPGGWAEFLARSFERATVNRRARPELVRQLARWGATWLAVTAAGRAPPLAHVLPRVPPRRELGWWAGTFAMLDWHLGMVEGPLGEPRTSLSAADALSVTRIWLAPRIGRCGDRRAAYACALALGTASDLLDGPLARRLGPTRLGRDLDRVADVCFFGAATASARRAGWVGNWAWHSAMLRHLIGVTYTAGTYFRRGVPPPRRSDRLSRPGEASLAAGLALGTLGWRRLGTVVIVGGSVAALLVEGAAQAGGGEAAADPAVSRASLSSTSSSFG